VINRTLTVVIGGVLVAVAMFVGAVASTVAVLWWTTADVARRLRSR
jgi:hypothetical protein